MCIPHGATNTKSNGYIQESKPKKHIKKVSKEQFENGDPDFIDERHESSTKDEKTFLGNFLKNLLG